MSLKIIDQIRSPNYDPVIIPIEFAVIHYTACSLERALNLFSDPKREVSSHFIIDLDGTVYELVQCLNGNPYKAWHSGESRWNDTQGRNWETFNLFSVGIEIVNENGNLFPYTDQQYKSLANLIQNLIKLYPALSSPERIIGHEQIAGFRGKSDPGICFNWERLFTEVYQDTKQSFPHYKPRLPHSTGEALQIFAKHAPSDKEQRANYFSLLSQALEGILYRA